MSKGTRGVDDYLMSLTERTVKSQEQIATAMSGINTTLQSLEKHYVCINDTLGTHVATQDQIIAELKGYIIKLVLMLLVAVGGASLLKLFGVF